MRPLSSTEPENIGWAQWFGLFPEALPRVTSNTIGMARYWFGARGDPLTEPLSVVPPKTPWTDAADRVASVQLKKSTLVGHSKRTWYFAMALARHDGECLDSEMVYVASMLHDTGLFVDDRSEGFAAAGAELARTSAIEAGVDDVSAVAVANAIWGHASVVPRTVLGRYLQDGSLLDVAGARLWHIDPNAVDRACAEWSRIGFRKDVLDCWSEECRRFPYGRAAYARFPCLLTSAARVLPCLLDKAVRESRTPAR